MKKVNLLCQYGENKPGTATLEDDVAEKLVANGNAEYILEESENDNSNDEQIKALEDAVAKKDEQIETLTAMLKEAITLPKGQAPEGYKG